MIEPGAPSRILPLEDATEEQEALLAKTIPPHRDRPPNVFATLAQHPLLCRRVNALGGLFITEGTIAPRERELVILRVATQARSKYEFSHHASLARGAGLTGAEITATSQPLDQHDWRDTDAELLGLVDELYSMEDVSDQTWGSMEGRFAPAALMELIFLVCFYRTLSTFVRAVRIQLEDEVDLPPLAADWE